MGQYVEGEFSGTIYMDCCDSTYPALAETLQNICQAMKTKFVSTSPDRSPYLLNGNATFRCISSPGVTFKYADEAACYIPKSDQSSCPAAAVQTPCSVDVQTSQRNAKLVFGYNCEKGIMGSKTMSGDKLS